MSQMPLAQPVFVEPTTVVERKRKPLWQRMRAYVWCYLFMMPAIVLYVMFTIWPILASWYYSFFDRNGLGMPNEYVGLSNFIEVTSNPYFWNAFGRTFQFMFGVVLLNLPLTLIMAVVLNNKRLKGAAVYRSSTSFRW